MLNVNGMTRFLASISVTTNEVKAWQAWAVAFIKMELEEHLSSNHTTIMRQVRDSIHAYINADPKWVFTILHTDAPRNYNLELKQIHNVCHTTIMADTSNAIAGLSSTLAKSDAISHVSSLH